MTIKAHCFTNLDDFRSVEWPTVFAAVPRVGDRVEEDSKRSESHRSLRVVAVTHGVDDKGHPRITVELHR